MDFSFEKIMKSFGDKILIHAAFQRELNNTVFVAKSNPFVTEKLAKKNDN